MSATSSKIGVTLRYDQHSDAAAVAVLRKLLDAVLANLDGAIDKPDSEHLHDFRVAVRRSRAVQRELRRALGKRELSRYRDGFRWLQRQTGDARDVDVYVLEFDQMRRLVPGALRGDLDALLDALADRRAEARRLMARELRSQRTSKLLSDWSTFLDGVEDLPLKGRPDAHREIGAVAGARIRKLYRRMVKMGAEIDEDSPSTEYHELRKQGKELRYMLELFGQPLYPDEVVKPMVRALKGLQTVLGRHQDREIQVAMVGSLRERVAAGAAGPAALPAMDLLAQRLAEDQRAARSGFAERFEVFAAPERRRLVRETFS
jgi:CHAD domain-containing protein